MIGDDDTGAVAAALPSLPALPLLYEANARRAPVTFRYRGEERTLDPYGMLARDGFWYVMGRDHRSDEQRTFRVDRMEGEPTLGAPESFAMPDGFDPARAVPDDPKLLGEGADEAFVRIDAARAPALVRELGDRVGARDDAGRVGGRAGPVRQPLGISIVGARAARPRRSDRTARRAGRGRRLARSLRVTLHRIGTESVQT